MWKRHTTILIVLIIIVITIIACDVGKTEIEPVVLQTGIPTQSQTLTSSPTFTPSPTQTSSPTPTETPSLTPSPSPTPTLKYPILPNTPLPSSGNLIDSNNLDKLTEIARWGGMGGQPIWSSDNGKIGYVTLSGVYILDSQSLNLLHFIPTNIQHPFSYHTGYEGIPVISPKFNYIAQNENDKLQITNIENEELVQILDAPGLIKVKTNPIFSPDEELIASSIARNSGGESEGAEGGEGDSSGEGGGNIQELWIWEVSSGDLKYMIDYSDAYFLSDLKFSPDGKLLVGAFLNYLIFWDPTTGDEINRIPIYKEPYASGFSRELSFSQNGSLLALIRRNGKGIQVFSTEDQKLLRTFDEVRETRLSFSPDNIYIAIGTDIWH
jgi:hypothetical protein